MVPMPTMVGDSILGVRQAETVPENGVVRHFDELPDDVQSWLIAAANGRASQEDAAAASASLDDGEFVVYTGYYQVQLA